MPCYSQVSDAELEDIVKVGQRSMPPPSGVQGASSFTQTLLGDYSAAGLAGGETPLSESTQRTPMREDIVMQEARNLRILREMTPLTAAQKEDEELPQLAEGTGFEGIVPRSSRLATPNVVLQTPGQQSVSSTPGPSVSVSTTSMHGSMSGASGTANGRTPMRDQYHLNQLDRGTGDMYAGCSNHDLDAYSVGDATSVTSSVMSSAARSKHARSTLAMQLSHLPEPEYTYEVSIPDTEEGDGDEGSHTQGPEDAADVQRRIEKQKAEQRDLELARRSAAVKRSLPRPPRADSALGQSVYGSGDNGEGGLGDISSLVNQEMLLLLRHDAYAHPDSSVSTKRARPLPVDLEGVNDAHMAQARELIRTELNTINGQRAISTEEFGSMWEQIWSQYIAVPRKNGEISHILVDTAPKSEVALCFNVVVVYSITSGI